MSKVVMECYLSHCFCLWITFWVFIENFLYLLRHLERTCIFIVDRPISFRNWKTIQFADRNRYSWVLDYLFSMNFSIISSRILNIFDDDIANLKSRLPKPYFQKFNISHFFLDVVSFSTHNFLCHHILILPNKSFLWSVKTDKNSS